MQLLASRTYPFINFESLEEHQARDSLFQTDTGAFVLHLSSSHMPNDSDRLVWLSCRSALIWINGAAEDFGVEWES
jgi:hypothetical protein